MYINIYSNVEIAFALALKLNFSVFSRMGLEYSITQNCVNEESKCDLSEKLCI